LIGCSRTLGAWPFPAEASAKHQSGTAYFETLYRFTGHSDGRVPVGALLDEYGTLYGTTNFGGDVSKHCTPGRGCGAVFALTGSGSESKLYDFKPRKNGLRPYAGLAEVNGALVGTTQEGGTHNDGTVFTVTTAGAANVLWSFNGKDGNDPRAALTLADGVLYGTTYLGGSAGAGTVFALTPSGSKYVESVLHSFQGGKDGALPTDGLIAVNGVLYGTTSEGGASNDGTIFEIGYSGEEQVLYSFKGGTTDGARPFGGLVDLNGTIYGTTSSGGAQNKGTIFALAASGSESLLHSFGAGMDGATPDAGLTIFNGQLYGNTRYGGASNNGTIYTIDTMTSSASEAVLYSFTGGSDGFAPYANLVAGSTSLYGTTLFGGLGQGYGDGTVFEITP
jgi:uncharacterized repeat protein (TIGR03803 family)